MLCPDISPGILLLLLGPGLKGGKGTTAAALCQKAKPTWRESQHALRTEQRKEICPNVRWK